MAVDNYIKVVGNGLHEIFLFDSLDPSSAQKAHEQANECASEFNAKRPKAADGHPEHPAHLSAWKPFRHLEVIGNSRPQSRLRKNDDD